MKHVVIVGGGFAGLNAAKVLGKSKKVKITLIDKLNHHLFQPLLYQVAMAALKLRLLSEVFYQNIKTLL